jgi:hypothetical protein
MKKELRKLLLSMYGSEAKRLFEIFRNPKNFDPDTLFSLISHEKLAARVLLWQKRTATDRDFLKELSTKRGVPGAIKRAIRERIDPQTRRIPTQTVLNEDGTQRLVTRDELYDLVWSKPLSSLASQFGMTDNGVRNRCKACAFRIGRSLFASRLAHTLLVRRDYF